MMHDHRIKRGLFDGKYLRRCRIPRCHWGPGRNHGPLGMMDCDFPGAVLRGGAAEEFAESLAVDLAVRECRQPVALEERHLPWQLVRRQSRPQVIDDVLLVEGGSGRSYDSGGHILAAVGVADAYDDGLQHALDRLDGQLNLAGGHVHAAGLDGVVDPAREEEL